MEETMMPLSQNLPQMEVVPGVLTLVVQATTQGSALRLMAQTISLLPGLHPAHQEYQVQVLTNQNMEEELLMHLSQNSVHPVFLAGVPILAGAREMVSM